MQTHTVKTTCDGCKKSFSEEKTKDGAPIAATGDVFDPMDVVVKAGTAKLIEKIACSPECARTVLADLVEKFPHAAFGVNVARARAVPPVD